MSKITVMSHPDQFTILSSLYDFSHNSIKRINYSKSELLEAVKESEMIFLVVSYQDHDIYSKILEASGYSKNYISIIEPHNFYSVLATYCPKKIDGFELLRKIIYHNLIPREYYAYGIVLATAQAQIMNIKELVAVEFGVFRGRGLKALSSICMLVTELTGITFHVYGFDTGAGLPIVSDWRDHPELWGIGDMVMPNPEELKKELLSNCKLIIGDIAKTLPDFKVCLSETSPLGFFSIDVDTYSSTKACLNILSLPAIHYLPVVPVWVDDSYINITQSIYAGEALAIEEFNRTNLRKIEKKIIRTNRQQKLWHHTFYFAHIFDHPDRNKNSKFNFLGLRHTDF